MLMFLMGVYVRQIKSYNFLSIISSIFSWQNIVIAILGSCFAYLLLEYIQEKNF